MYAAIVLLPKPILDLYLNRGIHNQQQDFEEYQRGFLISGRFQYHVL